MVIADRQKSKRLTALPSGVTPMRCDRADTFVEVACPAYCTETLCDGDAHVTGPHLVLDSITHLTPAERGRIVLAASHGGTYVGYFAARMGVAGAIFNDAGIGREEAGTGGVRLLERLGVPAATVSHRSARIGDGADCVQRGVISFANTPAAALGLAIGMTASDALAKLSAGRLSPSPTPPKSDEHVAEIVEASRDGVRVFAMDSISLVTAEHANNVAVTASHGGLLGGNPKSAVKFPVLAVVCNDAGRGIDDAGVTRLPALDARGIMGACVSAFSARIGDGHSTWSDGYISAVNSTAERAGGRIGQSCRDFVSAILAGRGKRPV
jgi:hypothetical protein